MVQIDLIKENINPYKAGQYDNFQISTLLETLIGSVASQKVLTNINDFSILNALTNAMLKQWGLSERQADVLLAAIALSKRISVKFTLEKRVDSSMVVVDYARQQFTDISNIEEMLLITVNSRLFITTSEILFRGNRNSSICDISLILRKALLSNADGIIIVHNHPSQSLIASGHDIEITARLKEGCKIMGVNFYDHIIITETEYLSIKELV